MPTLISPVDDLRDAFVAMAAEFAEQGEPRYMSKPETSRRTLPHCGSGSAGNGCRPNGFPILTSGLWTRLASSRAAGSAIG